MSESSQTPPEQEDFAGEARPSPAGQHADSDAIAEIYDVFDDGTITLSEKTNTKQPVLTDSEESARYRMIQFEEMSLAQMVGQFMRSPRQTWRALWEVAQDKQHLYDSSAEPELSSESMFETPAPVIPTPAPAAATKDEVTAAPDDAKRFPSPPRARLWQLILYLLAFAVAWQGNVILINAPLRSETTVLANGAPFLIAGFFIWFLAELVGNWGDLQTWWAQRRPSQRWQAMLRVIPTALIIAALLMLWSATDAPADSVQAVAAPGFVLLALGVSIWLLMDVIFWRWNNRLQAKNEERVILTDASSDARPWYMRIHPARILFAIAGGLLCVLVWLNTANNIITTLGFYAWLGSIALWCAVFLPLDINLRQWLQRQRERWQHIQWREQLPIIGALLLIIIAAAVIRLHNLTGIAEEGTAIPPEMTSDHVEKLLDAARVLDGEHNIFFANNGGRESFQMYALALFSYLPGQSISFNSLKLLAVIEALFTFPALYWMGRQVIGSERRQLGIIVGLLLAALVAVSYWHVAITRLSLRIVLTPLVTALLVGFLARAMRHNRRSDFIMAGLVLGFGLYTYQAVRMLPVVVVVAIAIAFYMKARTVRFGLRYGGQSRCAGPHLVCRLPTHVALHHRERAGIQPPHHWALVWGWHRAGRNARWHDSAAPSQCR